MIALAAFATLALASMLLIAVLNAFTFPRLDRFAREAPSRPPSLSVLIPARNEAANISAALSLLLAQEYPHLEVIVLDDHSTDGTPDLVLEQARSDPRLRLISGAALPPGWTGKNWACHQLARAASGELLLFTDADVLWSRGALRALVAAQDRLRADLLTVWPTQQTLTWAERLVVPLVALAIQGYLPVLGVHYLPFVSMAAANGQCLLFRRSAYFLLGGHESVRSSLVEDISLARRVKRLRLRLRMADGAGLIACRMYAGWPAVRDGFAKNILAGHGNLFFLALSTLFHWLVFLGPWLWLALGWMGGAPGWPGWPLALIALGLAVRMLTAFSTRQRVADGLLLPVSVILMTVIAFRSAWWQIRYGGPLWKGRRVA